MIINPKNLTVISVAQNDSGLANLMVRSVKRFTNPIPQILIADRGGNKSLIREFLKDEAVVFISGTNKDKTTNTSTRHAQGLNALLPLVKTKFTAIVESDCVVLREDWFDFDATKYDMMASLKKREFGEEQYHICFMVFRTDFLYGVDWMPLKTLEPVKCWRDSGFRIFSHIKARTERIHYLHIKACTKESKIFKKDFGPKSFEIYKDDGMPISAHFGRGSDLGRRINNSLGSPKHQKREWGKTYSVFITNQNKLVV